MVSSAVWGKAPAARLTLCYSRYSLAGSRKVRTWWIQLDSARVDSAGFSSVDSAEVWIQLGWIQLWIQLRCGFSGLDSAVDSGVMYFVWVQQTSAHKYGKLK